MAGSTSRSTKFEHGERVEFVNQSDGVVGAIQYAPNGEERALAVGPGETVWLSEAEQELTAKAPKRAKDSPFEPQPFEVRDPERNHEVVDRGMRPPLVRATEERPIPGAPAEEETGQAGGGDDAPEGSLDEREEVGTPDAQGDGAKKRRRVTSTA